MAAVDELQPSKQGAEAKVYVSEFYGRPCIIKERFVKTYRVLELDQKLTQKRISQVRPLVVYRSAAFILLFSIGRSVLCERITFALSKLNVYDFCVPCCVGREPPCCVLCLYFCVKTSTCWHVYVKRSTYVLLCALCIGWVVG